MGCGKNMYRRSPVTCECSATYKASSAPQPKLSPAEYCYTSWVLSMFPFQPALKRHQLFSYLLTPPITCLSIRLPFLFCSLSWALLSLLVDTAPVNHPFSWALQPPQVGSICPSFLCYSCRNGTKSFCHVLWNLE